MTNVRFTVDGNYLISVGGHDKSIFQWKYVNDNVAKEEIDTIVDEKDCVIDEESEPSEKQKLRESRNVQESNIFNTDEVAKGDEFLAVKPFLGEVLNSVPSGYKQTKDAVFY